MAHRYLRVLIDVNQEVKLDLRRELYRDLLRPANRPGAPFRRVTVGPPRASAVLRSTLYIRGYFCEENPRRSMRREIYEAMNARDVRHVTVSVSRCVLTLSIL